MRTWLVVIAVVAGCAQAPASSARRILFIGNSLTYVNDVPGIVQAFADSAGAGPIEVQTVAFPDFALVDHWNEGTALKRVREGHWDVVVLQQGPSSVEANRDTLRMYTKLFGEEIGKVGGRTALYSVWPTADRRQDFDRSIESYTLAAQDVKGVVLPAGAAWLAAWRADPSLALYFTDGLHASVSGSYLAALAIYARLLERSPRDLPSAVRTHSGGVVTVNPATAAVLRAAADDVTK